MAQAPPDPGAWSNVVGDVEMGDVTAYVDPNFQFPASSWVGNMSAEQAARGLAILNALRVLPKAPIQQAIREYYPQLVTGADFEFLRRDRPLSAALVGEDAETTGNFEPHYLAAYLALFGEGTFQYSFAEWLVRSAQQASEQIQSAAQEASAREQEAASGFYQLAQKALQDPEPELVNRGTAILRATRMIQTMRREMETRGSEKPAYTVVSEFIPRINHWRYSLVALMAQNSQDVRSRSEILREYLRWEIELAALIYVNADTERQRDDVLNGLRRSRAVVETADRFGVIKTSQGDGLVESWRRFPGRGSSRETESLLAAYGDGKPKAPPKSDKGSKSSTDKSKRGGDSDSGTNNLEKEITAMSTPLSLLNVAGAPAEKHPEVHEEEHRPPGETVMFCLP